MQSLAIIVNRTQGVFQPVLLVHTRLITNFQDKQTTTKCLVEQDVFFFTS